MATKGKSKAKKSFSSTKVGKAISSVFGGKKLSSNVGSGSLSQKGTSTTSSKLGSKVGSGSLAPKVKSTTAQTAKPSLTGKMYGPPAPTKTTSKSTGGGGSYKAAGSTPTYGTKGASVLALQKSLNQKYTGQAGYTPLKEDSMYGPKTLAATKFQPSSTVLSNENKVNQVPAMVGELDKLKDKGIRTDEQGNTRYADGSFVPEDSVEADTADEDAQIQNYFKQLKSSLDSSTQGQISNIEQKFEERKRQQAEINRRNEKANQNALLIGGVTGQGSSAQYAPISSQGIMQAQETYGLQQIATLDSQEQDLIAQAVQAQEEGNFRIMEKKLELVQQKRKEKVDAAAKLNEQIAKRNEELRKQVEQSNKDNAVIDMIDQGITDVPSIVAALGAQGMVITAKDVSEALNNLNPDADAINKILSVAAENGAPESVLRELSKSRSAQDAIIIGRTYMSDPMDRSIRSLQMQKLQAELGTEQGDALADSVMNENNPVKLIASFFQRNPKIKSEAQIQNATAVISSANEFANSVKSGKIKGLGFLGGGFLPQAFKSQEGIANKANISALDGKVQQWLSGAALSTAQEKLVKKLIPDRNDTDATVKTKINQLTNYMLSDVKGRVAAKGAYFDYIPVDFWATSSVKPGVGSSAVQAVAAGYEPAEIVDYVLDNYPDQSDAIIEARNQGYTDEEIIDYLSL